MIKILEHCQTDQPQFRERTTERRFLHALSGFGEDFQGCKNGLHAPDSRLFEQVRALIVTHAQQRQLCGTRGGHHQIAKIGDKLIPQGFELHSRSERVFQLLKRRTGLSVKQGLHQIHQTLIGSRSQESMHIVGRNPFRAEG